MKKNMLITGGTGFLGRRLGRFFKEHYDVVLAGRNHDQNRLAQTFSGCRVVPLDVASIESVRDVFSETRPAVVVHAAASKYVDVAEAHPMECIDVNVLGSQNVMRVAIDKGVETVIGVSTDKAAPPVANTYGLTKALMERMLCGMDGKTATEFACVRFGNLPWSTGSVFPVWKRMQETSGIIGTTGPEMFRFFN
ncbi:MAG: polysaccharide biosynthesis protein, partial [Blastocatellia bacterium]